MDYDYEQIRRRCECDANKIKGKNVLGQKIDEIERGNWDKLNYPEKDKIKIKEAIFGDNTSISLTREQVFDETKTETKTKIMKVLMWGYQKPFGTPNKAVFESIANHLGYLERMFKERFDANNARNLNEDDIMTLFEDLKEVSGLGKKAIATTSKLLYFFNVSFNGKRCLIYDSNVIRFLNHTDDKLTLCEDCYGEYLILNSNLKAKLKDFIRKAPWKATGDCYFEYLDLMDNLKTYLNIDDPAKIEMYMFEEGKELAAEKKDKLKELKNKEKELKKNANLKDNS